MLANINKPPEHTGDLWRDRVINITDVASLQYCESALVLGKIHGRRRTKVVQQRIDEGIAFHKKIEAGEEFDQLATQDRRCFIATHVYGSNAIGTQWLRDWRDDFLMKSIPGRLVVNVYYFVSPGIVRAMEKLPILVAPVRRGLDILVCILRGDKT